MTTLAQAGHEPLTDDDATTMETTDAGPLD
jgi:hypothetical protein